jgi:hypothetical protein
MLTTLGNALRTAFTAGVSRTPPNAKAISRNMDMHNRRILPRRWRVLCRASHRTSYFVEVLAKSPWFSTTAFFTKVDFFARFLRYLL